MSHPKILEIGSVSWQWTLLFQTRVCGSFWRAKWCIEPLPPLPPLPPLLPFRRCFLRF
ncbi:hypothetical protein [Roseateles sp. PN1]|uniref:hypothetical protein n=1 Tax=Roseateles sp. PN1 TaxID=3137372 RepID=UPI003139E833